MDVDKLSRLKKSFALNQIFSVALVSSGSQKLTIRFTELMLSELVCLFLEFGLIFHPLLLKCEVN